LAEAVTQRTPQSQQNGERDLFLPHHPAGPHFQASYHRTVAGMAHAYRIRRI
jgi:hypothetical protein